LNKLLVSAIDNSGLCSLLCIKARLARAMPFGVLWLPFSSFGILEI